MKPITVKYAVGISRVSEIQHDPQNESYSFPVYDTREEAEAVWYALEAEFQSEWMRTVTIAMDAAHGVWDKAKQTAEGALETD